MASIVTSKYFCDRLVHKDCIHDWDADVVLIKQLIDDVTVDDPFHKPTTNVTCNPEADEKDKIIAQLLDQLRLTQETSESYWQQRLAKVLCKTSLRREVLGSRRFVTDFSNPSVLIELKNQKDIRTAIGQVGEYMSIKKKAGHPVWFAYILLFGNLQKWTSELWKERQDLCARHGITLRWLKL